MTRLGLAYDVWRKSRRSGHGGNCVEVSVAWRRSIRSGQGGNCVEVARLTPTVADNDRASS
ncbi:DUF397 domain-containing protein [Actinoallomurus purpureus]|uniref:DUF397 domain-containing protein n=1 Tax=Actinoallomurus purpureus TaxID=478114 RepID=UPI0020929374|nr:DUF397 domain-containing protein [Actinoallomurus purpureus]MCO6009256.1 DUF397 domain-containing protein [Actinoallomurus purpureus]